MDTVNIVTVLTLIFHLSTARIISQDADNTTIHLATPEHVPDTTASDQIREPGVNFEYQDIEDIVEESFDQTNNVDHSKLKQAEKISDDNSNASNEISRPEVSYEQLGAQQQSFSFIDDNIKNKNEDTKKEEITGSSVSNHFNSANKVFKIYDQDSEGECSDEKKKNGTTCNDVTDVVINERREQRFVYHELNNAGDYVNLVLEHVAGAVEDTVNIYIELIPLLTGCFGSVAGCHLCVALTALDAGPRLLPGICLQKCAPGVFSACLSLVAVSINRMISFFLVDLAT